MRKSTRHLYMPSSLSLISSTKSCAGCDAVRKNALSPKAAGDDHNFACPNCRPLTSKLKIRNRVKINSHLTDFKIDNSEKRWSLWIVKSWLKGIINHSFWIRKSFLIDHCVKPSLDVINWRKKNLMIANQMKLKIYVMDLLQMKWII